MGFVSNMARGGMFGLAGKAAAGQKKPVDVKKPMTSLDARAGRKSLLTERNM